MRLWTLHPRYLDRQGLVALWRETLLAQAVLLGHTKGYRQHPQLARFRDQPDQLAAIGTYLEAVWSEANERDYRFDGAKITPRRTDVRIPATEGQLHFEWSHLTGKLQRRAPQWLAQIEGVNKPVPHPLFRRVPGAVSPWEKVKL